MFDIYIKGKFVGVDYMIPTKGYAISQDGTKILVAVKGEWMTPTKKFGEFQWWNISDTAPIV